MEENAPNDVFKILGITFLLMCLQFDNRKRKRNAHDYSRHRINNLSSMLIIDYGGLSTKYLTDLRRLRLV